MQLDAFSVIYQDHHLLIVNKPAGIVIHPTYRHADGTMWDAILAYLEQQGSDDWQPPNLPDDPAWAKAPAHVQVMLREKRAQWYWQKEGLLNRPRLLHRLDKDTSGIVALARTERSCRHIIRQFEQHTIRKRYLAVVQKGAPEWTKPQGALKITGLLDGKPERDFDLPFDLLSMRNQDFMIEGSLMRDPADRRRCIVGSEGQHAATLLKVLAVEGDFGLVEARLVTGRTHQIRAHLAALGNGIVGDQTYALPAEVGTPGTALGRQFLHAYSLELRRYPDNVLCEFVAPLADDLVAWLENYFPQWSGVIDARKTVSA
ncbi:MAG TPA: RluA family pseudouridine synthase [Ktedonobacteraceae bacterium]|nr:RluA family pseudouridine synthase [Ktedonobacteraceae bacterium]